MFFDPKADLWLRLQCVTVRGSDTGHLLLIVCILIIQAESKDEAEKPSESAEKSSDKTEAADKVKKEGGEASEREDENEDGAEAKSSPAGNTEV